MNRHDGGAASAAAWHLSNVYADAGAEVRALWLPSCATDPDAPDEVRAVGGLKRDTATLVMQANLAQGLRHHAEVLSASIAALARFANDEPVAASDLEEPETGPGQSAWVMVRHNMAVTGAWSFLHERDRGTYAVWTLPRWRRRGLARSLIEHVPADAHQ